MRQKKLAEEKLQEEKERAELAQMEQEIRVINKQRLVVQFKHDSENEKSASQKGVKTVARSRSRSTGARCWGAGRLGTHDKHEKHDEHDRNSVVKDSVQLNDEDKVNKWLAESESYSGLEDLIQIMHKDDALLRECQSELNDEFGNYSKAVREQRKTVQAQQVKVLEVEH